MKVIQLVTVNGTLEDSVDLVTLATIKLDSVVIGGSTTPTNPDAASVAAASSSLSTGLSNTAQIGNLSLSSVSVVSNGVSTESTLNLPMIFVLAFGIPIFLCKILLI